MLLILKTNLQRHAYLRRKAVERTKTKTQATNYKKKNFQPTIFIFYN